MIKPSSQVSSWELFPLLTRFDSQLDTACEPPVRYIKAAPAPSRETSTRKRAFHSSVMTLANQSKVWPTAAIGLPATNQAPSQMLANKDKLTRRVSSASTTAANGGVKEMISAI